MWTMSTALVTAANGWVGGTMGGFPQQQGRWEAQRACANGTLLAEAKEGVAEEEWWDNRGAANPCLGTPVCFSCGCQQEVGR